MYCPICKTKIKNEIIDSLWDQLMEILPVQNQEDIQKVIEISEQIKEERNIFYKSLGIQIIQMNS